MSKVFYTIGHSTHTEEQFLSLLKKHNITAVADVRSQPYSHQNPQFNREKLKDYLKKNLIKYVFLGKELGARSDDLNCYKNNKVLYSKLENTNLFKEGVKRLIDGANEYRIAMMCAEKEPTSCHRTILVSRYLDKRGYEIEHILANGQLESQKDVIRKLMKTFGLSSSDMFSTEEDLMNEAMDKQSEIIAYTLPENASLKIAH